MDHTAAQRSIFQPPNAHHTLRTFVSVAAQQNNNTELNIYEQCTCFHCIRTQNYYKAERSLDINKYLEKT